MSRFRCLLRRRIPRADASCGKAWTALLEANLLAGKRSGSRRALSKVSGSVSFLFLSPQAASSRSCLAGWLLRPRAREMVLLGSEKGGKEGEMRASFPREAEGKAGAASLSKRGFGNKSCSSCPVLLPKTGNLTESKAATTRISQGQRSWIESRASFVSGRTVVGL